MIFQPVAHFLDKISNLMFPRWLMRTAAYLDRRITVSAR